MIYQKPEKGSPWSRDEMMLVLNLYLKLPYGKMHKGNPLVKELAEVMGRSASTISIRLSNFASCDPLLEQRGIKGMSDGRKRCLPFWDDFMNNKEKMIFESEKLLADMQKTTIEKKYSYELGDIPSYIEGTERLQEVKTRVNQNVFRQIVLANYNNICAITGIDIPTLLIASHIIPWAKDEKERLNPSNGICLSALYDKAFDKGLISFDNNYCVLFSSELEQNVGKSYFKQHFEQIRNQKLIMPQKYMPNKQFLEWHRDVIFIH